MRSRWWRKIVKSRPVVFTASVLAVLGAGLLVAAFVSAGNNTSMAHESTYKEHDSGFIIAKPGSYDSEDIAVIKEINEEEGRIAFMNIETGKYYTLSYDGTTIIHDKHGASMAMSQMQEGDIVDVSFLRGKKKLTQMKLSESAWVFEEVQKYNFDVLTKSAEIGGGVYGLRNNLVVSSEGKDAQLEDIIRGDIVSISGIGNSVYSVVVEKGHGYLRLSNDEYFLKDGWIEVGQSVIQQITEDMLLAVPEGTYDVHLTAGGIDETRKVTVYRNQEVTLDVGDIEMEAPKTGKVIFAVMPGETTIYIDGKEVDITKPVEMEYGVHQMIAKADGYDTITQYIKVGQELASISVTLEESEEETEKETEAQLPSSVSGNDSELTSSYRVYIDSPTDVEVYLDGMYIGMSPVNFKKESGTHTITLRKPGYVTKSYTIQIDNEPKDVTYSFTDLEKSTKPTISGNTISGNSSVSGN